MRYHLNVSDKRLLYETCTELDLRTYTGPTLMWAPVPYSLTCRTTTCLLRVCNHQYKTLFSHRRQLQCSLQTLKHYTPVCTPIAAPPTVQEYKHYIYHVITYQRCPSLSSELESIVLAMPFRSCGLTERTRFSEVEDWRSGPGDNIRLTSSVSA